MDPGSLLDLVAKAEVVIHGLYHADARDLEITLLHQEHSCSLVTPSTVSTFSRAASLQFGLPVDRRYIQGFGPNTGKSDWSDAENFG